MRTNSTTRHPFLLAVLVTAVFACTEAMADTMAGAAPCPLPGQTSELVVQMYFGQNIEHRGPVTPHEWNDFLRRNVTPRFPDGFTVYDAYGQWQDRESHRIARENSKVI
ncbi:MAG: DUF3574 domain-containing protein, partial [Burkholderiaceae bacterium]|nr:DUF3574 domain-containing protein [Burkholderiaceae bacterium]